MNNLTDALSDIKETKDKLYVVFLFGWQDVKQRYRRSKVGPFWLTLSMAVMIGTIGLVFGQIFASEMKEFLPFLAAGIIIWTLISTVIAEGCTVFITSENMIKQLSLPFGVYVLRMLWRNLIILAHNIVILPIVFIAVGKPISAVSLISLIGLALVIINLSWISLILGVVCARFRDLPQIVNSCLQVLFYITPIMWMPNLLPERASALMLDANPLYHIIEIVRSPLLGHMPTVLNWSFSIAFAIVGWCLALIVLTRFKSRVPYWV